MRTGARLAGVVLAVGLAVGLGIRAARRHGPAAGPPGLSFRPGARQAYRLSIRSVVRLTGGAANGPRTIQQRVAGTLHLRVLDPGPEGARVALQLWGASLALSGRSSAALDAQLGSPFIATFAADGAIARFELPPSIGEEAGGILQEAVRTFEVVVPPGARDAWTAVESHASGRYRAAYRLTSDGRIVKSKAAYLDGGDGAMRVSVRRAEATARIDPGASWIERMVAEEELTASLAGGLSTVSSMGAELVRVAVDAPAGLDLDAAPASYRELSAALASRAPAPRAPAAQAPPAELRGLPELVRALQAKDGKSAALLYELRDLLIRDPAAAGRLLALLRAGVSDGTAAALLNALGMAATEEAQEALRTVMRDRSFGNVNRSRAALALGGASEIGNDSLAALRELAGGADGLADTAVLALGMAADTLRKGSSARYDALRSELVRRADGARDGNDAAAALLALGNTHDPGVAAAVAGHLADVSPAARAAAAHALGKLGGADPALLASRLASEPDGAVRYAIASSLNALPPPDATTLALVNGAIARERNAEARLELARLLGENLGTWPAARATLVALSKQDPSRPIRVYATHAVWGR